MGEAEAAAQGWYATPGFGLSSGPPGTVVIAPGDLRGCELIPDRCDGSCCGLDDRYGPNLACARCSRPVATLLDDCGVWQAVRLDPRAVHGSGDPGAIDDWETVLRREPLPPVEPDGRWNPVWEAAAGAALAHLLAASGGHRVAVPDGLTAATFRRAADQLLPPGPPTLTLALAGPGVPPAQADLILVPEHPQTGEPWHPDDPPDLTRSLPAPHAPTPPGPGTQPARNPLTQPAQDPLTQPAQDPVTHTARNPPTTTARVPLHCDVWLRLADRRERRSVPGTGAMPAEVDRDDPPPPSPFSHSSPDRTILLATLARRPEVQQPWLRAIYDRLARSLYSPF